jgi:cellulose synthase/poly-beta-1,6-N-acetylglucosamine synthase-like glycosyltransferase
MISSALVQALFIASSSLIGFVCAGYPILVWVMSRLFGRPVRRTDITPSVSMIIPARNEQEILEEKIENTLSLDYPSERLEIIVVSDGSTDRTDQIARAFAERKLIQHCRTERLGKTLAQKEAVRRSSGSILVFSDSTSMCEPDAIRKIVRSFADPDVGAVAGQLVYRERALSRVGRGCRTYWSWEKFLKRHESRSGSVIGMSGSLYSVRRSCYARLADDMIDDLVLAVEIHLQGLRAVYDEEAVAWEYTNSQIAHEFSMRVRVIVQTLRALYSYRGVLNPVRHGFFAVQLGLHKLLRYMIPFLLAAAFLSAGLLSRYDAGLGPWLSWIYKLAFAVQVVFYSAAVAGQISESTRGSVDWFAIPYYFLTANAAVLVAFVRFIRGDAHVTWEPVREPAGDAQKQRVRVASPGTGY